MDAKKFFFPSKELQNLASTFCSREKYKNPCKCLMKEEQEELICLSIDFVDYKMVFGKMGIFKFKFG